VIRAVLSAAVAASVLFYSLSAGAYQPSAAERHCSAMGDLRSAMAEAVGADSDAAWAQATDECSEEYTVDPWAPVPVEADESPCDRFANLHYAMAEAAGVDADAAWEDAFAACVDSDSERE
jgi:hypothetical protein